MPTHLPTPSPRLLRPAHRRLLGATAVALTTLPAGSACTGPRDARAFTTDRRASTEPTGAPAPYDDFAFALLGRLTAAAPGRNAFVSPASAGLAFSMALEGADGVTRDSLAVMLGVAGLESGEVTRRNAKLLGEIRNARDVTLTVANALWGRADVRFAPAFLQRVRDDYGAEVTALDLAAPAAVARINAWTRTATHGKIPEILAGALSDSTVLVLTNAVYFKGQWTTAFAPTATAPRPFHLPNGSVAPRPLMRQTGDFGYAAGEGFHLVRLPYRGRRLAMYVVLPDSGRTLPDLMARLTAARFRAAVASTAAQPVAVALPRFTLHCTANLGPPVASLGAAAAFDPARANFGPMFVPGGAPEHVWIERAVQRTFISVNEEGTEAAAVTALDTRADSVPPPPVPFVVDRPFLFAIRDDRTGTLLFIGQVTDPAGACGG